MKTVLFVFLVLFFNECFQVSVSDSSANVTDESALLDFRNLVTNTNSVLFSNWTINTSFCNWNGVTCSSRRQRVIGLNLPNMNLEGRISPSIANLSFLVEFDISDNNFHGNLPQGLGGLPRLRVIDVQNNQLEGNIPPAFFQSQNLETMSLAYNRFSGDLWRETWNAPGLRILNLTGNNLTGAIHSSLGNLTKLEKLILYKNSIGGGIPGEIGNMSNLVELDLSRNHFTEYGSQGTVSTAGDVYSFGIMLMEILTKRRPTDEMFSENLSLKQWIKASYPNSLMEIADANLFQEEDEVNSQHKFCTSSVIELALDCSKEAPEERINMKEAVIRLNKIRKRLLEAKNT